MANINCEGGAVIINSENGKKLNVKLKNDDYIYGKKVIILKNDVIILLMDGNSIRCCNPRKIEVIELIED